jgi:hypothetical protein
MAGILTFHNKFHRANHHTLSSTNILDSGFDPIASNEYPFLGIFYNKITDERRTFTINTNSLEWYSGYTTIQTFSGNWMLTLPVYTTVRSLSNNWNLGYNAYTNLFANSSRYESVYNTVCSFSAEWGSPFLMVTNKVQEYTHAKTFSGRDLFPSSIYPGLSVYDWNLNNQQVAFITVNKNIFINSPLEDSVLNGGQYTLVLKQQNDSVAGVGFEVEFEQSNYRFANKFSFPNTNVVSKGLSAITVINFLAIDGILYGDFHYLSGY